ncbi:hypothetical protein FG167_02250 [Lacinutrix sp. WUR7]|uniref:DUF6090 family protein n=1 Tax=Lacinutrix sp. WUR7 TaxID=2653681 RepID=UPI00193CF3B1|nr:DUF6090 family protein [Lacinutrix sp. WUR7]QRM88091.1 hypothetical protein FG167_02250 [Lacinutrix sp. WUR7]
MIKFFRKIRYDLMEKNKTGKYLKYAIGEIVLVVIGILIALSINNWNETRKQKGTTNSIYFIVKEDLINDISEIDSFLKYYDEVRKPSFETVLNTKLTKEDWLKNPQYISVIDGYKDFSINQRGSELLKNQSVLIVNTEQNLASEINLFYNQHIVEIDVSIEELFRQNVEINKNLKKYDWFSSLLIHKEMEGVIDYISNNPIAKNEITLYYLVFDVYAQELINFRENAKELIVKIDNQLKDN